METLAFVSFKGGTGKSTISVNVAAGLANPKQRRVLLVDLDSQGGATTYLGHQDAPAPTIAEVLQDKATLAEAIRPVGQAPGLFLLPSNLDLTGATQDLKAHDRLASVLQAAAADFDLVVLDTPPAWGIITVNALVAANKAIAVVETKALSMAAFVSVVKMINNVKQLNPSLELAGVLPSRVTRTRMATDAIKELKQHFGSKVLPPVRESIRLAEAALHRQPIASYEPKGNGAADVAAVIKALKKNVLTF
jgi:chromosome partitioning protein